MLRKEKLRIMAHRGLDLEQMTREELAAEVVKLEFQMQQRAKLIRKLDAIVDSDRKANRIRQIIRSKPWLMRTLIPVIPKDLMN